jgi:hypothetical protein
MVKPPNDWQISHLRVRATGAPEMKGLVPP